MACGLLLAASFSACSAAPSQVPAETVIPGCFPPDYTVTPGSARPGSAVVVAAPDAGCDPRYGPDARIAITVTDAEGKKILQQLGPMNDAGGFRFEFKVPKAAVPGLAVVTAVPHGVDWCDDTGRNNRVHHPTGIQRSSCVIPAEPLGITP